MNLSNVLQRTTVLQRLKSRLKGVVHRKVRRFGVIGNLCE